MPGPEIFAVGDTIWCVRRRSYLTCSYLIDRGARGVVMIDAGMSSDGADMTAALRRIGRSAADVTHIFLTHWHNDHAAGARAMQQLTGAPVFYHRAERPWLTRATAAAGLRGRLSDVVPEWGLFVLAKGLLGEAAPVAVEADGGLLEHGQLALDGELEVIAAPGHTPGHVAYLYRPAAALFAGDALAVVDDQIRYMARPVTPDLPEARASMARLLDLDIDLLCPGHRQPLSQEVRARCRELAEHVSSGRPWPLLG